jgi:hypothetical protein
MNRSSEPVVLLKRIEGLRAGDRESALRVVSDLLMAADGDPRILLLAGQAAQRRFRLPAALTVESLLDILAQQSRAIDGQTSSD